MFDSCTNAEIRFIMTQSTRQCWRISRAGSIDNLKLEEDTLSPIAPKDIRVAVKAVGLNFADIFALMGLYSATPKGAFVPGLEFAGVVTAVGSEAGDTFAVGDRVMGVTRFGGYTTSIDIGPEYCEHLPEDWSFEEGAAFPVQTLTALYGLKTLGDVKAGQNVLIQSAAGGVGLQALTICRKLGVRAIGTVGSVSKKAFLAERGFSDVVVRGGDAMKARVRKILGEEPLHLALDAIGGQVQQDSYELLAPTGRLVVFGAAEFMGSGKRPSYLKVAWRWLKTPRFKPLDMIAENKSVMAFNLIWLYDQMDLMQEQQATIMGLDLPAPYVGTKYVFENAHAAIAHLQGGQSVGKVVLSI